MIGAPAVQTSGMGGATALLLLAVIVAAVAAADYVWLSYNSLPPHWDQANHMLSALQYRDQSVECVADTRAGLRGVARCARGLVSVDQSIYAPLFPFVGGMFTFVAGRSVTALAMVNVVFLAVLVTAVYALGRRMHSRLAGVIAAGLLCAYPLVFTTSREFMMELSLLALTATVVALLLASERFACRSLTLLCGLAIGLALLTKFTVIAFLVGPLALEGLRFVKDRWQGRITPGEFRRRVLSVAAASVLAVGLAASWYWPNRHSFLSTLNDVTHLDPTGASRFGLDSLTYYARAFVLEQVGPWFAGLFVAASVAVLTIPRPHRNMLLFWMASIYALLTVPSFKAFHNDIGILIPVAIITAIGLASLTRARALAVAAVAIFALVQLVTFSLPESTLAVHLGSFGWRGAERAFPRHESWPIEQALRTLGAQQARVAVISDHRYVNGTTAEFYARADRLPLQLSPCWQLGHEPLTALEGYDAVLGKSSTDWVRLRGDGCFVGAGGDAAYESLVAGLTHGADGFSLADSLPLPDGSSLLVFRRAASPLRAQVGF